MEDLPAEISSEIDRAEQEFFDGAVASAVARLRALSTRANRDGDADLEWSLCLQTGQYLLSSGDVDPAQVQFARAVALAEQLGDFGREFDSVIALSWARVQSSDPQDVRAAVKDLLDVESNHPESHNDRLDDVYGLLGLGHCNLGALGTGVNFLRIAVDVAGHHSSDSIATWHGNLGVALVNGGRLEEGLTNLKEAVRLEEHRSTGNLGTWLSALRSAEAAPYVSPADVLTMPSGWTYNGLAIRVSSTPLITDKIELLRSEQPLVDAALEEALHHWPALDAYALLDSAKSILGRELIWRRSWEHSGLADLVSGPFDAVVHGLKTPQVVEEIARNPGTCAIHLYYTKNRDFYALLGYCVAGRPHAERIHIGGGYFGHILYERLVRLVESRRSEPLVSISDELIDLLCEFGDALMPRLARIENLERVLFLPYKMLHALPLHALLSRRFPSDLLLAGVEVHYSSSLMANMAARMRIGSAGPSQENILFAFVDEEGIEGEAPMESAGLRALIGEQPWFTLATRAATIPADLSDFPFLLWSSHAMSDPSDWTRSYLGAGPGAHTAYEIMDRWHLNHTEMAVLSGCETGCDRSIDDAVDEYLGLDAAIHIAGARTVVSTLWPVTEDVAGVTSILLLIGVLFQHRSPGEALRQTQLALVSGQWRAFLTEVYTEVRDGKPRSGAGAEPVLERLLDLAPDSFTDVMDFAAYRSYGA